MLSFLVVLPVYADFTLLDNHWEMLTIPADASNNTLESLFGDELPINEYGQSWILFTFDSAQQEYIQPGLSDTLVQGGGFWMLQTTGSDVVIELPNNLPSGTSENTLPCAATTGCFSSRLPASTTIGTRWSLLGAPYAASVNIGDISLTTSEDHCNSGFDLEESIQAGYLTDNQWAYNSASEEYESLSDIDALSPWQGFWVATPQQSAPIAIFLLLPNPIGDT